MSITPDLLHLRCRDGVLAVFAALATTDLKGIDPKCFYGQLAFDPRSIDFPCYVVSIEDEKETLLGGTMGRKRIRYPVRAFLLDTERVQPEDTAKYSTWREPLVQQFHQRRRPTITVDTVVVPQELVPGVPEAQDTQVVPLSIIELQAAAYERVISGVKIMVECVFPRT